MSQVHAESTGDQHHAVDQPLLEMVDITQGLWWLTLCTHISVAVCLDAGCHQVANEQANDDLTVAHEGGPKELDQDLQQRQEE